MEFYCECSRIFSLGIGPDAVLYRVNLCTGHPIPALAPRIVSRSLCLESNASLFSGVRYRSFVVNIPVVSEKYSALTPLV
jgi:hypothetical protein